MTCIVVELIDNVLEERVAWRRGHEGVAHRLGVVDALSLLDEDCLAGGGLRKGDRLEGSHACKVQIHVDSTIVI